MSESLFWPAERRVIALPAFLSSGPRRSNADFLVQVGRGRRSKSPPPSCRCWRKESRREMPVSLGVNNYNNNPQQQQPNPRTNEQQLQPKPQYNNPRSSRGVRCAPTRRSLLGHSCDPSAQGRVALAGRVDVAPLPHRPRARWYAGVLRPRVRAFAGGYSPRSLSGTSPRAASRTVRRGA